MTRIGSYVIALLLVILALGVVGLSAPSERLGAVVVAGMCALGAAAALRRAARLPSLQASSAAPIGTVVGDVPIFLRDLSRHRDHFRDWAARRRAPLDDAAALLEWLHEHLDEIDEQQLLLPAIAAYGELVRRATGGEWRLATAFPRGELVVARRGRPWTRRRVLYEVLQALSA